MNNIEKAKHLNNKHKLEKEIRETNNAYFRKIN